MTRKEYNKKHPHLNDAQLQSGYHLFITDGWQAEGLTLTKGGNTLYLHQDGCALRSPEKAPNP